MNLEEALNCGDYVAKWLGSASGVGDDIEAAYSHWQDRDEGGKTYEMGAVAVGAGRLVVIHRTESNVDTGNGEETVTVRHVPVHQIAAIEIEERRMHHFGAVHTTDLKVMVHFTVDVPSIGQQLDLGLNKDGYAEENLARNELSALATALAAQVGR